MVKKIVLVIFMVTMGLGLVLSDFSLLYAQDEFTLEEITVTAEKREVDVQDIAMSVTAITGADIRDFALNRIEDVLSNIAGVEIAYAARGGQINIRGIGSFVDDSVADTTVAVVKDNVYNGAQASTFSNMYDTDRVEVLRGPQGTLWGRNATGGSINVVTRNPIHEFELMGNLQIGDYNLKHFDGAVNIPLTEKWVGRVAVLRETRDGYLTSGNMDNNVFGARAKLLWEPNDRFSVLANYDYFWERDHGINTVPVSGSKGNLPRLGPPPSFGYTKPDLDGNGVADDFLTVDASGSLVEGSDGIADIVQTGWVVPAGADPWTNDEWHPGGLYYIAEKTYSLEFNWDIGWSVLTAIPSFAEQTSHFVSNHLAGLSRNTGLEAYNYGDGQYFEREQTSGEVRLNSAAESDWFWIVGLYYMESYNRRVGQADGGDPTTYYDNEYHTSLKKNPVVSTAFFGQTTYPVTDRFRVTGGIRRAADDEERDYRIGLSDTEGNVLYDTGWLHYKKDQPSTTYKAGIEFDVGEDSMLYAQVATGFKQGGMNYTAPPKPFYPEDLVAYEVGMKNRFLDDHMQLNFEVYSYKYDQMQVQYPAAQPIGDTGTFANAMVIFNVDKGTTEGFDLEMDYLFTQNDRVSVSAAYLHSELGHFVIPPNPFGLTEPFDMTGRPAAGSPKWAGTISYEHAWRLDNGATVTSEIDTKISDGYYRTLEQWHPYAWNEGYHRSNANMTYRNADGTWSVSTWIKNLENGAQYTWSAPFWRAMIKAPRTFGVNVSFRY